MQERYIFRLARLIVKSIKEDLTEAENVFINEWANAAPDNKKIMEEYRNEVLIKQKIEKYNSIDWENDFYYFVKRKKRLEVIRKIKIVSKYLLGAAAILAIIYYIWTIL